jgi:hypothetical protein
MSLDQAPTSLRSYGFDERARCPVCRSERTTTLYSSPFTEGPISAFVADYYLVAPERLSAAPYQLARCLDCALVYQKWVGDAELLTELYGEWINEHCPPDRDAQYQDQIGNILQSRDAHEIMVAAAFLGLKPSEMATLDYGMGWGLWARIAQQLGCDSYGSDLSPSRMEFARAHGVSTIAARELGHARFHFINLEQVLEHLTQPGEAAQRLASSLLPGGILKVSVPSAEKVDAIVTKLRDPRSKGIRDELMPVQPLEHVNSFTRRSLRRLAELLGLQIVEPGLRDKYAFLAVPGAISLMKPKKTAKELVRPVFQFRNPRNIYVWMQVPRAGRQ